MSIFNASQGAGGSSNSAQSVNQSQSSSYSYTNGAAATANSNWQASIANNSANTAWEKAALFNAQQAQIQREWQERMANTVYQRSVADMRAAGINPVLAASFGLSSANVGSGATASMSAPDVFMGSSFADQNSASQSSSYGESSSHGQSWNESESGLATFLASMQSLIDGILARTTSSNMINIALNGLEQAAVSTSQKSNPGATELDNDNYQEYANKLDDGSLWGKIKKSIATSINGMMHTTGGYYNSGH